MITPDGWLDWAERMPGPADKKYSQENACQGHSPHSMVGYAQGWYDRLFCLDKLPDGRYAPYAAASVTGSVLRQERNGLAVVVQHYPLQVSCWANGSRYPNTHFNAWEFEGGYQPHNEPLTPGQFKAHVRVIMETSFWGGWEPKRPTSPHDVGASLYEHRECFVWGSSPTACPSSRFDWGRTLKALAFPNKLTELQVLRVQDTIIRRLAQDDWEGIAAVMRYLGVG